MPAKSSSIRLRRILGLVHLWAGIILTLPFVVLGITGSLLVYDEAILHVVRGKPELAAGTPQSPGAILSAALAAAPQSGMSARTLRMPEEPGAPATVRLGAGRPLPGQPPFAGTVAIQVDPVSLRILEGSGAPPSWLRLAHDLHGRFLIDGRTGREIVGWAGVAMFVMGLTGLAIWWPKAGLWRRAFTIGKGARGLRLHRELHGAVGIWSLVVFLTVTFSGIYLAFPQTLGDAIRTIFPGRDPQAVQQLRVTPASDTQPMGLDAALARIGQTMPGLGLRSVFLPMRPDQPIRINLAEPGRADGAPAITVAFDPWKGEILDVQDPRTYTLGETLSGWQRAVHYGQGLGPVYKALVFMSGLILPLFSITGISMWLIKRKIRRTSAARQSVAAE